MKGFLFCIQFICFCHFEETKLVSAFRIRLLTRIIKETKAAHSKSRWPSKTGIISDRGILSTVLRNEIAEMVIIPLIQK